MVTRTKATVRLKIPSDKQLTALLNALKPEAKFPRTSRSKVKMEKEGLFLVLMVEAADTVALRSTLNAYLRLISSTLSVISLVEQA